MALTKEHLRAVMSGTLENRVEELRQILGYPVKEFDREGSRFWYLRPGESAAEAADTCPIAVGFYAELNEGSDHDIRQFLTSKEQQNDNLSLYICCSCICTFGQLMISICNFGQHMLSMLLQSVRTP